jgi:hypothetical protein
MEAEQIGFYPITSFVTAISHSIIISPSISRTNKISTSSGSQKINLEQVKMAQIYVCT